MKKYRFTWHVFNVMNVAVYEGKTKRECVDYFKSQHGLIAFRSATIKNITNEICAYSLAC